MRDGLLILAAILVIVVGLVYLDSHITTFNFFGVRGFFTHP